MEQWHRVVTLSDGVAMVVTDLHGDWDLYRRYRDWFLRQYERGEVQYLIFTGDLIHQVEKDAPDGSLQIVLDVSALQKTHPGAVIYLLGNHEMVHIYHVPLSKNDRVFTPAFEAAMGEHRPQVLELFAGLPFFVRTKAGVSVTHAGAAAALSEDENVARVFAFDHRHVFERVDALLAGKDMERLRQGYAHFSGIPYRTQAERYFAVSSPDDPRYDDLLRGVYATSDPDFELLWEVLFTRCEKEYGNGDYGIFLNALLVKLSHQFVPQQFLVAGHISVRKGAKVVSRRHLRIASGVHAVPPASAQVLLFDTGRTVRNIQSLRKGLRSMLDIR